MNSTIEDPYERKQQAEEKLSRRNAVSAQQGLRELDGRISELHKLIMTQQQTIRDLLSRMSELETSTRAQQAMFAGSGPTVKVNGHID